MENSTASILGLKARVGEQAATNDDVMMEARNVISRRVSVLTLGRTMRMNDRCSSLPRMCFFDPFPAAFVTELKLRLIGMFEPKETEDE